ncbi:MAG: hypothetical protein Q4C64_06745 [Erysipelotrichia bacterium]|nr:hypothetical protein [Erysipelotrichia bacterium]
MTIGQIATAATILSGLFIFYKSLKQAFKDSIKSEMRSFIDTQNSIKKDVAELGDVCYQMLDHMATNNNTGGMKKALDEYNKYNRHN